MVASRNSIPLAVAAKPGNSAATSAKFSKLAQILAVGYLRLQKFSKSPANPLAIPAPQSDESEPGLNSTNRLNERGSDV